MISDICHRCGIKNYIINNDGSISVDGDVDLYSMELTELPLKFNIVVGNFNCSFNHLTTLNGSPNVIIGDFNFSRNEINSLKYSPNHVTGDYYTMMNKFNQIDYYPDKIVGDIYFDEHVVIPYGMGHSVVPYGDYDNYILVKDYDKWYNTYHKINKRKNIINNILHSEK